MISVVRDGIIRFSFMIRYWTVMCVLSLLCAGCNSGQKPGKRTACNGGSEDPTIRKIEALGGSCLRASDVGLQWFTMPPEDKADDPVACVSLRKMRLDKSTMLLLHNFSHLRVLSCRTCTFEDGAFEVATRIPHLTHLDLLWSTIPADDLHCLTNATNLVMLYLSRESNLNDSNMKYLSHMKHLKELILYSTPVIGSGFKSLAGLKQLESLSLGYTKIDNSGTAHLAQLTSLKNLDLSATSVTSKGLLELAKLPGLIELSLAERSVGFDELQSVSKMPALKTLSLWNAKVPDAALPALKDCPELLHLDLSHTSINDNGLQNLKGCDKLLTLDLRSTSITNQGLLHLYSLPKLSLIILTGTKTTYWGRQRLEKAKPKCQVVFEG